MQNKIFQVDTFTDKIFGGNPACVVPLKKWLPDEILLKIASENAVAETAFFLDHGTSFPLRWFTPDIEMDLCGHASLATAHVLKTVLKPQQNTFVFNTLSGDLIVNHNADLYTLDFPTRVPIPAALPEIISQALSVQPQFVLKARDYVLVYEKESDVKNIVINRNILNQINLDPGGIIITAKGDNSDFVSRFFTSQASLFEDYVTGSSHCSLIPYWSERLGKKQLMAYQISDRIGQLFCENAGSRVLISGKAITYSEGIFYTE
ncbi:MAG: PhzF family phenazine biosynthesis protein [Flavobacterium sp.]|nr:PhzF family phenazine biosynthesis protein [Flavobacterium sp.]